MTYDDLTPEIIKKVNSAYTKKVKEAFKPLLKKNSVYFDKINEIAPSKVEIMKSVSKEFNIPNLLTREILDNNRIHLECKDKIAARRNAVFIREFKKGKSIAELSQRYGLSEPLIHSILQQKPRFRKEKSYSYASVLDELGLRKSGNRNKEKDDNRPNPSKSVKKRKNGKPSYNFEDILNNLGNADYLKLKLSKKK
ncbi:MAG: hypothetical protein AB7G44_04900 [Bacteroidia bacterium]